MAKNGSVEGRTSFRTKELLRDKFPGQLISRITDIDWSPRSCHLTPLEQYLDKN